MKETLSSAPSPQERAGDDQSGINTTLQALLGRASERGRMQFLSLVRADQLRRWQRGERVLVEEYLERLPRLHDDAEALLDLIFSEVLLREELGERTTADEYVRRFPQHEAQIRLQFEMHQELLASAGLAKKDTKQPAGALTGENLRSPGVSPDSMRYGPDVQAGSFLGTLPTIPPVGLGPGPERPVIPGYEVLGELGRGGMGVVYKARHLHLKRLVALKMLLGEAAGREALLRFQGEAESIAQLAHPNFVQVYEVGEHQGQPYIALEFVEGGSLDRRLHSTPQAPRESAALVRILALAMQAAHEKHIIHRDLKPANVLLAGTLATPGQEASGKHPSSKAAAKTTGDPSSLTAFTPKITDFGLAKNLTAEAGQTISGAIMGTPSYMAPEQAEGRLRDIDARCDVYALGAILYEMLTGRPPFRGASVLDTLEQVRTQEPVPPSRLTPKLPRDVETICLKCLQKEPVRRYQSAQALADDLQCYLDGRPISARPVSAWHRALKWARRRPAQAALVGAVVLAVLGGAAGALFYGLYKDQQAAALSQRLERGGRVDDIWGLGQAAETAGRYPEAKQHYDQALAILDADPDLLGGELRRRIAEGHDRARRKLEEKAASQEKSAERADFQKRSEQFGLHRDQVRVHAVSFREQDAASDTALVRREAPAALAQLEVFMDSRPEALTAGLRRWRPLVESPEQLDRLASECYQVLLVWAEVEAASDPRQALRLLGAAAALGNAHRLATPRTFHLQRGRVLALLGDKDGARVERDRAAAVTLSSALDHFQAGLDSYRRDQIEQAAASCEEALGLEPNHFWAQYLKVVCNVRARPPRWREAKVGLTACLGRMPGSPSLLLLLGAAHGELQEFAAAEDKFRLALDKADTKALRATVLTSRSTVRIRAGRWDDARRDLLEAIQLQPKAYHGYVNLAQAYRLRGDLEEAVKALDRALQLRPDAALYNTRARLQAKRGKPALARADFEQVLAREPPGARSVLLASARVELAHLKHLAREYDAALADCEAALAAQPNYAEAHRQRAETLLALGKYDEAGKAMDRYLAGGAREPVFYQVRGLIHTQRGEHVQAAEAYTRSILLKPDAKTLSYRGWAYLALESPRLALPDFEAALQGEPKNRDALCGRGLARVQLGRAAEATADAEAALRQAPQPERRLVQSCARIYARAVGVFEAEGDRLADGGRTFRCQERALQLLREALKLVPEAEWVAFWRTNVSGDPAFRSIRNSQGWRALARACAR